MAQNTDLQLDAEKDVIKNETIAGANTATRVGTMFENLNDSKINNNKIDSADTLDTADKTVAGRDATKAYIAAQLAALDVLFLGLYTSLGALETAHPTADSGQYAIVDPGPGTDAVKYLWDEDEGWVEGGSSGGGDFLTLTGDPYDNTALEVALNAKADVFETQRDVSGAHTLDATDLGHVNEGEDYVLNNTTSGVLTLPLNATVDFPESTFIRVPGFTTVAIAGGGTVNGTNGTLNVVGDDSYVRYLGSDTWTLYNGEPAASSSTPGLTKLYTSAGTNTDGALDQNSAQVKLVSGTNIKTVGGASLLGSGDIAVGVGDALVANPLSQFAPTTSAQLLGVLTDETGTGSAVFATAPTLVNPIVGTQTAGDNSTKAASTAYVDDLIMPAATTSTDGYLTSTDWNTFNGKQASGLSYLLASGGTLTGANTITGTTTNILKYVFNGLSTTHVDGAGHWLANLTSAAAGVQQISPATVWEGQGWKTNATAESQSVKCRVNMLPIQGAANPTGSLNFAFSVNGAAYSSDIFQIRSGLTVPIICDGVGFSINNGGISLSSASPITNTLVFGTNGTISSAGLICSSGNGGVVLGMSLSYTYTPASGSVGATTLKVATSFAPTSIYTGGTFRSALIQPTYNVNVGTGHSAILLDLDPVITFVTNVTEYGIVVRRSVARNGFGLGATLPVATVEIGAGTTTQAPLKLNSGTNLTSAVDGTFEFDGSDLFFTKGGTRRTITMT